MLLANTASAASSGIVLQPGYPSSQGGGGRTATFRLGTDGYVYNGDNGVYTVQYQWKQNANASSGYEAFAAIALGSVSGTTGSWVSLGSNVDWTVTDISADGDAKVATLAVSIRNASTLEVLASETIEFLADRWS